MICKGYGKIHVTASFDSQLAPVLWQHTSVSNESAGCRCRCRVAGHAQGQQNSSVGHGMEPAVALAPGCSRQRHWYPGVCARAWVIWTVVMYSANLLFHFS